MTRVISLSDDAYDILKDLKRKDESFSQVVRRLTADEKKKSLMDVFGIAKDDADFIRNLEKSLAARKDFKVRDVRL
ncbi:MAG: antitoxin VapB family protein [Nanoarchaeota archaeon]